jgi:ADP-L-glycero-D-manno-heptose 6-epimerase
MIDQNSKILITGGGGFIGSTLIQALNKQGYKNIYILDTMRTPGKYQNLVGLKFKDIRTSLGNWNSLYDTEFKVCIHLGAITDTKEQDFNELLDTNYKLSKVLYNSCRKFIYASSSAVYGSFGKKEETINAYGFSKLLFDNWLRNTNLDKYVYGLRFTNVYGQREHFKGEMCSILYKYVKEAYNTGNITSFDFSSLEIDKPWVGRDFIDVKDITQVIISIMEYEEKPKDSLLNIMDVGTGITTSFSDLIQLIQKYFKLNHQCNISNTSISFPKELENHYQYITKADTQQVSKFINNFTPIEKGVEELVNYFTHKNGRQ